MDLTSTCPTDIATLHLVLREQQLIESLKANLHRLLKWRFGPKSDSVDVSREAEHSLLKVRQRCNATSATSLPAPFAS